MKSATIESPPQVTSVPIDVLLISELNPRREKKLDPIELQQLADSIRANGILQPLIARRAGKALEVIAGRRRLEAAKLAGLTEVPVLIRELKDEAAASAAFVENEQRAALRPLDSALAVARRLDAGETIEQVAAAIGKPLGWVARRANLRNLPVALSKRLETPGDQLREWPLPSLELLAMLDPEDQEEQVRAAEWDGTPPVRDLKSMLARAGQRLSLAPWHPDDAELLPTAGACNTCPYNSASSANLFGDLEFDGKKSAGAECRNSQCWQQKLAAHTARRFEEVQAEHGKGLLRIAGPPAAGLIRDGDVKDCKYPGDYTRVKKGTPGAKPALVVEGKDYGAVVYVTESAKAASKPEPGKKGAAAKGKPAPKPNPKEALKASTERLERRRMAWVVDTVRERIGKSSPPAADVVLKLAAVFQCGNPNNGRPMAGASTAAIVKAYERATIDQVWQPMRERNLIDPLKRHAAGVLQEQHRLAVWLADIVLDAGTAAKLETEAIEAVPAPKSLTGLKQTKPKAAKKKSAPAARTKKAKPEKARAARGRKGK